MTINERVSDTQIDRMIDRVGSVIHVRKSLTGSGECGVVEVNAELFLDVLRELQQYRAAAEPARNPVLGYADSYRDMAKRGVESVPIWSVITDLERNIAPLFSAPQVTSVPETLPCPVILEPGLRFGKGVRTKAVLDALQRRATYYAELEGMTPEQRAEHDAGIKEFSAMLAAPPVQAERESK